MWAPVSSSSTYLAYFERPLTTFSPVSSTSQAVCHAVPWASCGLRPTYYAFSLAAVTVCMYDNDFVQHVRFFSPAGGAFMEISVVDLSSSSAPDDFTSSLHETGFAVLVNHPIPFSLVQDVWAQWLAFFASERKWEFRPMAGEQDGFHSLGGSELAVGANVRDIKEYFHFYPWGRSPQPESKAALELFEHGRTLAEMLLGWVQKTSPALVTERFSVPLPEMLDGSHRTLLRVLHYPPLTGTEPEGSLRAAAHEDINLLTVLPAANEPGLQVMGLDGSWFDVPCDPGSVVINAGDMLDLASAGFFPSTTHRVLNPPLTGNRPRCSTPLFLHPADPVVLGMVDNSPYTAFDFLNDRITAITGEPLSPSPTNR